MFVSVWHCTSFISSVTPELFLEFIPKHTPAIPAFCFTHWLLLFRMTCKDYIALHNFIGSLCLGAQVGALYWSTSTAWLYYNQQHNRSILYDFWDSGIRTAYLSVYMPSLFYLSHSNLGHLKLCSVDQSQLRFLFFHLFYKLGWCLPAPSEGICSLTFHWIQVDRLLPFNSLWDRKHCY